MIGHKSKLGPYFFLSAPIQEGPRPHPGPALSLHGADYPGRANSPLSLFSFQFGVGYSKPLTGDVRITRDFRERFPALFVSGKNCGKARGKFAECLLKREAGSFVSIRRFSRVVGARTPSYGKLTDFSS